MKKILLITAAIATMSTAAYADNWAGNYAGGSLNTDTQTAGAHVGRFYDMGTVVLGAEAGVNRNFSTNITTGTIEGLVGVDAGKFMPYVSAGWTTVGTQMYGAGLNYQLGETTILGVKWNTTGGTSAVSARVSFSF